MFDRVAGALGSLVCTFYAYAVIARRGHKQTVRLYRLGF